MVFFQTLFLHIRIELDSINHHFFLQNYLSLSDNHRKFFTTTKKQRKGFSHQTNQQLGKQPTKTAFWRKNCLKKTKNR